VHPLVLGQRVLRLGAQQLGDGLIQHVHAEVWIEPPSGIVKPTE